MEAKYENSSLVRLAVLNSMVDLAKKLGFELYDTPKSITTVVERADGTTVTEYLSGKDIEEVVGKYIARQNELPACALTEDIVQLIKEEAIKEYIANSENEKEND